jgi:hypothetical protein
LDGKVSHLWLESLGGLRRNFLTFLDTLKARGLIVLIFGPLLLGESELLSLLLRNRHPSLTGTR